MPKIAIIYPRVSDPRQVQQTSLKTQEHDCRIYAKRMGYTIPDDAVFLEEGESAKTADRTQLHKALEYARENKVDAFIVHRIDRFMRDSLEFLTIRAQLARWGVRFLSATENLTDDPDGRFMETIFAAAAQRDNEVRAERSRRGMVARAEEGGWVWRAPLGYRNCKDDRNFPTLRIDEETAPMVRKAFEMIILGESQAEVVRYLRSCGMKTINGKQISNQSVFRLLRNPVYIGYLKSTLSGPELVPGKWPALIESSLFWETQDVLNGTRATRPSPKECQTQDFFLRGWVNCAECGRPLVANWSRGKGGKKFGYYRCAKCKKRNAPKERIEDEARKFIELLSIEPKLLKAWRKYVIAMWMTSTEQYQAECGAKRKEVDVLLNKKKKLLDLLLEGKVDQESYDLKIADISIQLTRAQALQFNATSDRLDVEAATEYALRVLQHPLEWFESANNAQKRRFIAIVFPHPLVWDGEKLQPPLINRAIKDLRQFDGSDSRWVTPRGFEPLLQG